MMKKKRTDDGIQRAQERWMSSVNKHAVKLGMKFLRQYFVQMRYDAMKTNSLRHYRSKSERMKASWLPVNAGGILPMSRDELVPASAPESVFELEPYVMNAYGDPGQTKLWFEEALQSVKRPKILDDVVADDSANSGQVLPDSLNDLLQRTKNRKSSDFSDFNFD